MVGRRGWCDARRAGGPVVARRAASALVAAPTRGNRRCLRSRRCSSAWTVFVRLNHPLTFLCIPVCIWAGMRFGQREASTTACVLSAIAVWGTLRGHGALASASLNTELLLLQAFVATAGMVGLVVGATV